ncbi:MAG: hypothetical protein KBG10_02675 [Anaerolineaceae bacterium]|nr:hypothetical protein [Anaerolineaceae bacterium]
MLFRVLVFFLLVIAGYQTSRRIRGNTFSISLVSTLLVVMVVVFFVLGKKLFAMVGFSMYLMLIILGFAAGIFAGLTNQKKQIQQSRNLPRPRDDSENQH